MIIDTSAVLAILFQESDRAEFALKIKHGNPRLMSAATLLEAAMVVEGRGGAAAGADLESFLRSAEIELVPVTLEQTETARVAWRRFGKGNHPARLNFGDCFSYALSKTTGEPLLFKGDDFAQTDIQPA